MGESYHRLRRAIAYAHGGRLRVRSQREQKLWNECARLVANAVIHSNGLLRSKVLKTLQRRRHTVAIEALGTVSPLSWQHINFYARYRFEAQGQPFNLAAIAKRLDIEAAIRDRRSA